MLMEYGFRENDHTADWELEVWAPDLPCLLEQAARGMYSLSGVRLQPGAPHTRSLVLRAEDAEGLIVRFLTELLWLQQEQGLGFNEFTIKVDSQYSLQADMKGHPLSGLEKEIKAVTYHNLHVESNAQGLRASIVFDV